MDRSDLLSTLPIVDLSGLAASDPNSRIKVGRQLVQVCHDIGFCYLSNHGISQRDLDTAFSWNKKFHNLPSEIKAHVRRLEGSNSYLGWHDIKKLTARPGYPDTSAQYSIGSDDDPHDKSQWLSEDDFPGFRAWAQDFYKQGWSVSEKVLRALALGLGLEEDFLLRIHDTKGSQIALKYYPPISIAAVNDGSERRLGAHTDFSSLTVLFQSGQSGLEIESKGRYVQVENISGLAVLNIGDVFETWSNGYLKSTLHRVGLPKNAQMEQHQSGVSGDTSQFTQARYSIPIFTKPKWDAVLEPMPGYEHLGKWKKQTFLEFYQDKLTKGINAKSGQD